MIMANNQNVRNWHKADYSNLGIRSKVRRRTIVRGLLSPLQINEGRKATHPGPEPSAARLAPWAFSTGVIVSLGEGFVWINQR